MKSKLIDEFKQFAMRGNVIDLAVGVVIGAAFGKIVSSLVADVIMPPIGVLVGGVNFTDLGITLKQAQTAASGETPAGISAGIALDEALAEGDVIRILRGVGYVLHPRGFA